MADDVKLLISVVFASYLSKQCWSVTALIPNVYNRRVVIWQLGKWLFFYSHIKLSEIKPSQHTEWYTEVLVLPGIGSNPPSVIWVLVLQRKSLPAISWQEYFIVKDFWRVICFLCSKKWTVKGNLGASAATCGRVCQLHLRLPKTVSQLSISPASGFWTRAPHTQTNQSHWVSSWGKFLCEFRSQFTGFFF